jgi:hypothetical protein
LHCRFKIVIILLLCFVERAISQQNSNSNLRLKKIATKGSIVLDNKSIVPNSLKIFSVDTSFYDVDLINATIAWKKNLTQDSVLVQYRVFAYNLSKKASGFNYDSIKNNFIATQPFIFKNNSITNNNNNSFLNFGDVNYNGSFGRSLSFGNNQDAVFNSQLNLQLNGFIGDSIEIAAAITDNNIPIQPDGNTQRLNEFDRILLQFKKRNWDLSLGDIDVRQNKQYFLNFYKRLQGASYSNTDKNGNNLTIAGAIAKGKFARNIINGQEGNQGPYRLQTPNNDFFFIVLAGSERIFIDGELLQRGEDQDYVINYNTSEITFTPKRMITKDKRLQFEFEYADRNFLNSVLYASKDFQPIKNLKINIAAYSNSDAKNSPINQQLNVNQKQFLANLGDSINNAFYPLESIDSFNVGRIMYLKRVNPINPSLDSIYVYSTNRDSAKYNLNFADVGFNKGNYIPLFVGTNGRAFQYIAPIAGVPQGNFEPAQFLITPKKQDIISLNAVYTSKNTTITSDIALSNVDVNTFSNKDKNNDKGFAAKISIDNSKQFKNQNSFTTNATYEWVDKNYRPLERLRSVEFSRDWGLPILPNFATEHLPKLALQFKDKLNNTIAYEAKAYIRNDGFSAVKHNLIHKHQIKNIQLFTDVSVVANSTHSNNGYFFKPNFSFQKSLLNNNKFAFAFNYSLEHNIQKHILTDTLTPFSFAFETITASIKSNERKKNKWSFNYFTRADKLPQGKQLKTTDRSNNYNFTLELLQSQKHQFRTNITYRQLQILNQQLTTQKADNSLLGRAEYMINEFKGLIVGNVLYELGAGQEQRRDINYIEVPAGRGEFTWIDYNNDGIQQLNEFEVARFQDQAKYVRIFTPTNQFIKANYTQFNYSFSILPRVIASSIKNKKISNIISRFVIQSSLQTSKKNISNGNPTFNPFGKEVFDTSLISYNKTSNNTISFNRFSNKWGIDIAQVNTNIQSLLTYGLENRTTNEIALKARFNIKQQYSFEWLQKWGNNNLYTPKFSNRNFSLITQSFEPKIAYTNSTKYRIVASYMYQTKSNQQNFGGEKSKAQSLNIEFKYNTVQSTSLLAKFTSNTINYSGLANSTISYIMLDGLLPGKNYLWTIEFTKRLNNNLELNFSYEGRKPGETRIINIGRASIRAIL